MPATLPATPMPATPMPATAPTSTPATPRPRPSTSASRISTGTVPLIFRNVGRGVFRAETETHGYEVHKQLDNNDRTTGYQALIMRRNSRHVLHARLFEFHQSATHWLGCECARLEHGAR